MGSFSVYINSGHVVIGLGLMLLAWIAKLYLPAYLKKKGENLATKEDIREITEKIEAVKSSFTYANQKAENLATKEDVREITDRIESVKADYGSRLQIQQIRYENEFKILLELAEKLVAVRDAAQGLRPEISYGDPNEPEEKKRRATAYNDAAKQFYLFVEARQPFYPEDIYKTLKAFEDKTWKEFVQSKHQDPNSEQFWDDAVKNGGEIGTLASLALVLIRQRAQVWEKFNAI